MMNLLLLMANGDTVCRLLRTVSGTPTSQQFNIIEADHHTIVPSPKVNPFHLLSHPNDTSILPPLPPHLQALASDTGDPDPDHHQNGETDPQTVIEESHKATTIYTATSRSTNSIEPQIHITKVTNDTVHIVPGSKTASNATEMTKPKKMMKKVGNVFKRDVHPSGGLDMDNAMVDDCNSLNGRPQLNGQNGYSSGTGAQRSPITMQGPPPSPPISVIDTTEMVESVESHALSTTSHAEATEATIERTTVEEGQARDGSLSLSSETTTEVTAGPSTNSKPETITIYTSNLTAEPADLATSSPIMVNPSLQSLAQRNLSATQPHHNGLPARRVSAGSATSSRTGSLAIVRNGRMAPQRRTSNGSVDKGLQEPVGVQGSTAATPAEQPQHHGGYITASGAGLGLGFGPGKDLPPLPNSQVVLEEWEKPSAPGMRQSSQSSSTASPTHGTNPTLLHPNSVVMSSSPTANTASGSMAPRMTRRSTNPSPISLSTPLAIPRSPLIHSQSTYQSPQQQQRARTSVPGIDGAALDSDILAQAETIRRERLERRQKKLSASASAVSDHVPLPDGEPKEKNENVIIPSASFRDREPKRERTADEHKVLVGNLIGEDHVNYVLMYNMLTGIRIGVSHFVTRPFQILPFGQC